MEKRDTLVTAMDRYLKVNLFNDYAPHGLQVEGAEGVKKIVTGVSMSLEFLEEAKRAGAQMVLVHHGLFWKSQSPVLKGSHKKRVAFLLENDLSLVAYHLPLDAHPMVGNNAQILKLIGAGQKKPFGEYNGMPIGFSGSFSRARPMTKILDSLQPLADQEPLYLPGATEKVKSVAVVSGGAGDLFEQTVAAGIDLFVTGEAWEPAQALARETGSAFVALGHYNSEKPGVISLGQWLKKKFKVEVEFIDVPNPA